MSNQDDVKEKKRKKQLKRLSKIVANAWELPGSEPFQDVKPASATSILCLSQIGEKIDQDKYRMGRHGYEDFAKDIGGVYNRHVHKKLKTAPAAKQHFAKVSGWLAKIDESLCKMASEHVPTEEIPKSSKKRKASVDSSASNSKKKSSSSESAVKGGKKATPNSDLTLGKREENAMRALSDFMNDNGGSRDLVQNFRCRVTRKPSDGRYDTNYYNEEGRRFRSMLEVGRFFSLVKDNTPVRRKALKTKKVTSREIEAEKKRLRKDLDRLRKQHTRATKALDDYMDGDKESSSPIEDSLLEEERKAAANGSDTLAKTPSRLRCAGTRQPDFTGLKGIPDICVPDVLMAWDFLCTFSRALSLQPISLDDFVHALTYMPSPQLAEADALSTPPVYLAEAHIALLRLLVADPSSDDWWWSILEAVEETESGATKIVVKGETDLPVMKIDFAALLAEPEDPLLTTSWVRNLEAVRSKSATLDDVKRAIRTAISVVDNKYVKAYLRKVLKLRKPSDVDSMKRAVLWLADRVREARADIFDRSVSNSDAMKQRAKVVQEALSKMDKLGDAAIAVTQEDLASDVESDDESDDDSDDEDMDTGGTKTPLHLQSEDRPSSAIPERPLPTLVDLLLPPAKPMFDLISPFSWPHLTGAAAHRIIHRYKRLRNEVDDNLRHFRERSQLTVRQRKQREKIAASRILSECFCGTDDDSSVLHAIEFLCKGGNYLELPVQARLCLLRLLIDAAYDTVGVFQVVDSNYKQRTNAVKALDMEQRKAKKEAKEKAASDEAVARQDLADELRGRFIEERREEIRKANAASQELSEADIDALTDEDIISFDEDIKADYEALPGPDSFKKAEVTERVEKIQEATAFEADSLDVFTMDELIQRERDQVQALEQNLAALGGEAALVDSTVGRATARSIEKLRRDLLRERSLEETRKFERATAIEVLRDSIADGTVKSLRNAIRIAKVANLFGFDPESRTAWALNVVRDAHKELEHAKQQKRVADAQKDLITKLNKCFIRTEPIGTDRVRNRFWQFENGDQGHIWVEVDYDIDSNEDGNSTKYDGFISMVAKPSDITVGPSDMEEDFFEDMETLNTFWRQEYHGSGTLPSLTKRHWGCHATEESLRSVIKVLNSRGLREGELKRRLKEALENKTAHHDASNEEDHHSESLQEHAEQQQEAPSKSTPKSSIRKDGDGEEFQKLKDKAANLRGQSELQIDLGEIANLNTGVGQKVRTRSIIHSTRDAEIAHYENGIVTGWKYRTDTVPIQPDGHEFEPTMRDVLVPVWRVACERGSEVWLEGADLLESICRLSKVEHADSAYFENDASYLAYRNTVGRFCGRATDALHASTPSRFAQMMIKKEAEIYSKIKQRIYDEIWGGRGANRNAWISSMKDYAFEFQTVRDGLLTLENAFFELTGGMPDMAADESTAQALLSNDATRMDIELESLEKTVTGIWNSRASRSIFIEIIKNAKSLGFLGLGLELLVRNARTYLDATKPTKAAKDSFSEQAPMRVTRRMNAWQQANHEDDGHDEWT